MGTIIRRMRGQVWFWTRDLLEEGGFLTFQVYPAQVKTINLLSPSNNCSLQPSSSNIQPEDTESTWTLYPSKRSRLDLSLGHLSAIAALSSPLTSLSPSGHLSLLRAGGFSLMLWSGRDCSQRGLATGRPPHWAPHSPLGRVCQAGQQGGKDKWQGDSKHLGSYLS